MPLNIGKSSLLKYFFSILSFLTTLFIIFLSIKKSGGVKLFFFPHQDKLMHLSAYGFLCASYFWAMKFSWKINNSIYKAAILSFSLGVLLEVIQGYLSYRTADFWDIIANFLGIIIFILIILKKNKKKYFLIL